MANIKRANASGITKTGTAISDVPDAPTIGTATAGVESASVTFTAAATGGAVTTYRALSTPGSIAGTSATSPITVSGLTAGTAYTFQVRGENSTGNSAYSSASNSVTPTEAFSYESIATASISGSSGEITFSNIPSGFQHLQIRSRAKTTYDDSFNSILLVKMQFNGNTTSGDYIWHWIAAERDSAGTHSRGANNSTIYGNVNAVPGAYASQNGSGINNVFAINVLDILDYSNTNKFKTTRLITGDSHSRVGNQFVGVWSGLWRNTSAITSIRLFVDAGNFMTNSSFALYGIKG